MDPETNIRLGAALGRISGLRADFVTMQAQMGVLTRQTVMIASYIDRTASQVAMIKREIDQATQILSRRIAHRTAGESAEVSLPPGSQSKWPANDLLDLSPLSSEELLKAKAVVAESAFWGMVYLAVHHVPRSLTVPLNARERAIVATDVERTGQDNGQPEFPLMHDR